LDGTARLVEILVLSRADQEARAIRASGDEEWVGHLFGKACRGVHRQPPPTATTISSESPSARAVSPYLLRGTISPFFSIATRFPESSSASMRRATFAPGSRRRTWPFTES